ncbi:hypothetical protein X765_19630 [Mesorhizobium sp. LSHC440B00]|nr:hypothetical protein X765_19630 [Mesorhizobium sp. LSHC440B00]ESX36478.1 hypothetical protein X763_13940 [Mesorhizobium sp. LSHC432A00]ESX41899.1 hypothetical protein X764_13435 [Mesorhizobium sp. LSHC440A00]ESZ24628.1 hypothetical protein X733_31600 [Mesorhizobium sp. L2C067A000]
MATLAPSNSATINPGTRLSPIGDDLDRGCWVNGPKWLG